jgi:hypothetical protein
MVECGYRDANNGSIPHGIILDTVSTNWHGHQSLNTPTQAMSRCVHRQHIGLYIGYNIIYHLKMNNSITGLYVAAFYYAYQFVLIPSNAPFYCTSLMCQWPGPMCCLFTGLLLFCVIRLYSVWGENIAPEDSVGCRLNVLGCLLMCICLPWHV